MALLNFPCRLGWPLTGKEGKPSRLLAERARADGADLIGGCPHLDTDPSGANKVFLAQNPDLAEMHARVAKHPHNVVDVVSRNLYPPRVADMAGVVPYPRVNHSWPWENP